MLRNHVLTRSLQLGLVLGVGLCATTGLAAQEAQPAEDPSAAAAPESRLETVVVTGSRIRQVDIETQQPVLIIEREELEKLGVMTVGDIINKLTVQGVPGLSRQTTLNGGTDQGGSYINMRNLGRTRTLVLVNGKRWVENHQGATDVSTIPSAVIERVEVLKDGASPIYGSDAVAGVVNIITSRTFDGAQARVYYGVNERGDDETVEYSATLGSAGDHGSVLLNLSYGKQGAMWDNKRSQTRWAGGPLHPEPNTGITGNGSFRDSSGRWVLNNPTDDPMDLSNYHRYTNVATDGYNTRDDVQARVPSEIKSLFAQGTYDFSDQLSFRTTALYSQRWAQRQVAAYPLQTSSLTGKGHIGTISRDSIYNPSALGENATFYHRPVKVPRTTDNTIDTTHLDAAMEGWFGLGQRYFTWDVGVSWSRATGQQVLKGQMNLPNISAAIGPSFYDASGTPRCGTPDSVIEGCIPWNVLADVDPATMGPDLYNYIFVTNTRDYGTKTTSYQANITGGLFDFPLGGEVAFAAGIEHRTFHGFARPDELSKSGDSTNLVTEGTDGRYRVNEGYAELSVPLLREQTMAEDLTISLATRHSRYSNFGVTNNSKVGFKWNPVSDFMLRGNYSESFRAPTIQNLFSGSSMTFSSFTDPCDTVYGANTYGLVVHEACLARLQVPNPQDFRQLDASGDPTSSPSAQSSYPFISGSNPDLAPETAKTRTLGFVYSPSWLDGLSVNADWYKVKIDNIISSVNANTILKECYQGNAEFCARFSRDAAGQVMELNSTLANRGTLVVDGVDVFLRYAFPETSLGRFVLTSDHANVRTHRSQSDPDVPAENRVGWYPNWKVRNNTALDWAYKDFGLNWRVRYFSSLKEACAYVNEDECNQMDYVSPITGPSPSHRVGSIAFNDLQARWNAPWNARISLGINNVLGRKPPIMHAAGVDGGAPPVMYAYDLDRFFYVRYQQSFPVDRN
ncbi:MAG: TonB-dependent receptor [Opitutaceae bacterium]|nr:TonB-dependent receptor [Opitutaceae bacterium]